VYKRQVINNYQRELENLEKECNTELKLSENFLNIAKVYEQTKLALLLKAEAELARALETEATAIASGNP
jgi:hypothetical protein